ncbi:MAG: endonuclease III [Firmicutes bacterium]|nr:endonuclease III [Bacillota bacterium]
MTYNYHILRGSGITKYTPAEIKTILDLLKKEYPDAGCALEHMDVFELAVCVVLSAQTTDASVNKVTHGGTGVREEGQGLFDLYPTAEALAAAEQEDVMEIIKTIGMYKTKSRNIINLAKALCEKHGGKVPDDYDALIALPGVGRKTANVILAVGFGQQRIAVDTHVFRVAHRIGLVEDSAGSGKSATHSAKSAKSAGAKEVLQTEYDLMEVLPEDRWSEAHHSLIFHGRNCCTARAPKCDQCVIEGLCRKAGV